MNHANEMTGLIFISVFLTDGGEMQKKKQKTMFRNVPLSQFQ